MPSTIPYYGGLDLSKSLAKGMVHSPSLVALQNPLEITGTFDASNIAAQQAANQARIPNAAGLEQQSSTDIASLLNPPDLFPDTSRRAAEVAAGRGVAGSGAGFSTAVRMTDEEKLRRIALGENLLSGAYARNPGAPLTDPLAVMRTQLEQWNTMYPPGRRTGGSFTGSTGPSPGVPLTQSPMLGGSDFWSGPTAGTGIGSGSSWVAGGGQYGGGAMYPNPGGDLLPLYPGGTPVGGVDQELINLGLQSPDYNPGQFSAPVGADVADYFNM